jgi:hypothetical protein
VDAQAWYAWITATNDDALTRDRLTIEGGAEVLVRGWPDDPRWRRRVSELLREGVPRLVERVGLPWPVDGALEVTEVHTPLLEGYAGFYDPEQDRITISEDLDDLTIVHEASHAWFNGSLFAERWIGEGLADEYAARVLEALGRRVPEPDRVTPRDEAAFPLASWAPPAAIRDETAAARESYGYAAAWTVMRRIVDRAGEEAMREALAAAHARTTAYPGEGTPEVTRLPNDWRRFLDLVDEAAADARAEADPGTAPGSIAPLLERWVLEPEAAALLAPRAEALAAYRALAAAGSTWVPPDGVRMAMDRWDFRDARALIDQAEGLLDGRDALAAEAAALGLVPPAAIEDAYQDADSAAELRVLADRADGSRAVLARVGEARVAAAAPRDWLAGLGLDGPDPAADAAAAAAAWEAGDDEDARALADGLIARLAAAPDLGRNRMLAIGAGGAAALVGLLILGLLAGRALGGRRAPSPDLAVPRGGPEGPGPYATLPPQAAPAAPPGRPAADDEGADRP